MSSEQNASDMAAEFSAAKKRLARLEELAFVGLTEGEAHEIAVEVAKCGVTLDELPTVIQKGMLSDGKDERIAYREGKIAEVRSACMEYSEVGLYQGVSAVEHGYATACRDVLSILNRDTAPATGSVQVFENKQTKLILQLMERIYAKLCDVPDVEDQA